MVEKMFRRMKAVAHVLLFALLFVWQLPQNIVALLMMPFLGKMHRVCYRNYCLCYVGERMQCGISLGNFAFLHPYMEYDEHVIAHEVDGHTVQSKILGPLYLLVIGIPSISWAYLRNVKKHPNYYAFYTESNANYFAGLEVYGSHYALRFKNRKAKQ